MKNVLKLLSAFVILVILIAGAFRYREFQKLKKIPGADEYEISFNCKEWFRPSRSFTDSLKVRWQESKSKMYFMTTDTTHKVVIAVDLNESIGLSKNVAFFFEDQFAYLQKEKDMMIKHQLLPADIREVIKSVNSSDGSVAHLTAMNNGFGIALVNGSKDLFFCAFKDEKKRCLTPEPEKKEESWKKAISQNPDAERALHTYCKMKNARAERLDAARSRFQENCPGVDFILENDLTQACSFMQ
jgi:hypothetical protein